MPPACALRVASLLALFTVVMLVTAGLDVRFAWSPALSLVVQALALAVVLVVRTRLEDATLREELAGYREYAGRVRYRLVPGVW